MTRVDSAGNVWSRYLGVMFMAASMLLMLLGIAYWKAGAQGSEKNLPGVGRRSSTQEPVDGVPNLAFLPPVRSPKGNPITPEKASLGKQLFFDRRLSANNTISCATCHDPKLGFGDGLPRSIGFGGIELGRNSPSLYTTAYQNVWFWDGRAKSLEQQVLMPIQAPLEMNQDLPGLVVKLGKITGYTDQFRRIFGNPPITADNIAKALATFLRVIVPGESPVDKFLKGNQAALSASARQGLALFEGKARCVLCHHGPNLTDDGFHNIGVPPAKPLNEDLGRYRIVPLPALKGAFKTPSLRMVARTAPYMHNGIVATLDEVIEFYDRGGDVRENLAPEMKRLNLTPQDKTDLKAFLLALTGPEARVEVPALPGQDRLESK